MTSASGGSRSRTPTTRRTKGEATSREALKAYEFRLREEDRYLGSVFANSLGQRKVEAKTRAAYDRCVALGMTHEHGL